MRVMVSRARQSTSVRTVARTYRLSKSNVAKLKIRNPRRQRNQNLLGEIRLALEKLGNTRRKFGEWRSPAARMVRELLPKDCVVSERHVRRIMEENNLQISGGGWTPDLCSNPRTLVRKQNRKMLCTPWRAVNYGEFCEYLFKRDERPKAARASDFKKKIEAVFFFFAFAFFGVFLMIF